MIGPLVNGAAVIVGSVGGAFLGHKIPLALRQRMQLIFGCASMGLGIAMIGKVKVIPAVILALLLGSILGELIQFETHIEKLAGHVRGWIDKRVTPPASDLPQTDYMERFIAVLVLFCASGTGIFGAMNEGMTGDPSLLLAKAFLDFFTAAIFAINLGFPVAALAVPQFIIQAGLYVCALDHFTSDNPNHDC